MNLKTAIENLGAQNPPKVEQPKTFQKLFFQKFGNSLVKWLPFFTFFLCLCHRNTPRHQISLFQKQWLSHKSRLSSNLSLIYKTLKMRKKQIATYVRKSGVMLRRAVNKYQFHNYAFSTCVYIGIFVRIQTKDKLHKFPKLETTPNPSINN